MSEDKQRYEPKESEAQAFITAESLGIQAAGIVYNQGKAKIFNLLESQLGAAQSTPRFCDDDSPRLKAVKRMAQDIISGIAKDVKTFITDMLGDDFQHMVGYVDLEHALTGEEEAEAIKAFDDVKKALK